MAQAIADWSAGVIEPGLPARMLMGGGGMHRPVQAI
jgi:hypothetical protein